MDSLVETRVLDYLRTVLHVAHHKAATVLDCIRDLARVRGFEVDERFAELGTGGTAGPEAQIAAAIVDRALGGGGKETSDYAVRKQIEEWLHRQPRRGH
jgi:hypothetical protein